MSYIIVRKNNIGIYNISESVDGKKYLTKKDALEEIKKMQPEYTNTSFVIAGE